MTEQAPTKPQEMSRLKVTLFEIFGVTFGDRL